MSPFDYRKAIAGNRHFGMTRKERGQRACPKSERSDRPDPIQQSLRIERRSRAQFHHPKGGRHRTSEQSEAT